MGAEVSRKDQTDQPSTNQRIAVIGAGPAGLTAAYLLTKRGYRPVVFEADKQYVGGYPKQSYTKVTISISVGTVFFPSPRR